MKSLTHSTRVVSIVSKSFQIFFAAVLLTFFAGAVNAQTFFVNWTGGSGTNVVTFTLPDGTTGTLTKTVTACGAGLPNFANIVNLAHNASQPDYPSNFYTPTPPDPVEVLGDSISRDTAVCPAPGSITGNYALSFTETVTNLRIHYVSIDSATLRFFNSASVALPVTRLSGNAQFEVTGNAINSTAIDGTGPGCQTAAGPNFVAGCGTIVVPGKHTLIRFTATDVIGDPQGDGFQFTMSLFADYGDAPASYDNGGVNEASHDLLATNLRLGSTVDADAAEKSGLAATGDDTTGTDDENGVAAFAPYLPAGGQTCTGTFGPYTTAANEYCAVVDVTLTGANAQLVGWLDSNGDGDFTDAVDRSVPLAHAAVDDGTFTTPNIISGTTAQAVLVWQGLPSTLPPSRYFRFRITRDASFLVDPQPTGAAIDGEVEDYAVFVPTAANVSISGRVMTAGGRGLPRTSVILTDMRGNSRTATTSVFGYFRFDEVQVGETYILTAVSKGYVFQQQTISVLDEMSGLDFIALE